MIDIDALATGVSGGERRALARAITLVESQRADHRVLAEKLLGLLATSPHQALRIGLSGTPGVGKSTFIEALGMQLVNAGKRVAVLAIDPSSQRSGGSILGDKTRMEMLSREARAFIRPTPAGSHLGGVARHSRAAVALCEAAGFDVILIETVGVGQSETVVAQMSDLFVLLLAPAGGDELQGVKRGIMEMADMVLVNKADGDLLPAAQRTKSDYAGALGLMRKRPQDPDGFPKVMLVSARSGTGMDTAWNEMHALADWRKQTGHYDRMRTAQGTYWFHEELRQQILSQLETPEMRARIKTLEQAIADQDTSISQAVRDVLKSQP